MKLSIILFFCCCLASSVVYAQDSVGHHDLAARDGLRQREVSSSSAASSSSNTVASSRSSITSNFKSSTSASVSATDASSIASGIGSAIGSVSTTGSASTSSATISVDPRSPPGGVSMLTPALTASETYIKVGDYATFSWTYTSLIVSPSAVNVEAYCSLNNYYYPIADNLTINDTQAVWNTSGYQATATIPLLVAQYTLHIYDAASNPTAVASPGYLSAYNNLYFGVYTPQPYTPLNNYQCATCSSASYSLVERNVLRGTLAMTLIACIFTVVFMMR
ncbi:hypothetical protein V1525DRAFT_374812 [Lipomyces kononenkoae]|uniref:Uncharacterized protein n=1 Tax=Lipomyces kononenkoae TaxID=34357 RepID=A0ACC3T3F2_LIPKO